PTASHHLPLTPMFHPPRTSTLSPYTTLFRSTDLDRVTALNAGRSYTPDVDSGVLRSVIEAGRYEATADASVLERSDVIIICVPTDRKSTRLNSSHQIISYAVFCLKKKKQVKN